MASGASLLGSLLVAGGLFVFAPAINRTTLGQPLFADALWLFGLAIPFDTLARPVSSTFRGADRATYQVFVGKVLRPVVRLAAVGVAFAVDTLCAKHRPTTEYSVAFRSSRMSVRGGVVTSGALPETYENCTDDLPIRTSRISPVYR